MSELKDVKSVEVATIWARRILPAKNSPDAADARQIEDAFQARLAVAEDATVEPNKLVPTVTIHAKRGTGTRISPNLPASKRR
jgi:hypothetical protein